MHIPKEKISKLDDKTQKGIFMGYSSQSKGYRIYSIEDKKLIISRDIEFDENAAWNFEEEKVEKRNVPVLMQPSTST